VSARFKELPLEDVLSGEIAVFSDRTKLLTEQSGKFGNG
jgi:hypothetical protein